jgi:hypothetical protein
MRTSLLASLALTAVLAVAPAAAQTGSPNSTPVGVSRITLIRIKPGHAPQFWQDMREHIKPVYDEYKRRGIISDYSVETKVGADSENDWSVVLGVTYPNYAALDNLASRTDPVSLAHYGSADRRTAATTARGEHGVVVQSFLLRNVTLNDWKP